MSRVPLGGPSDRYNDPATTRPLASNPDVCIGTVKYPRLVLSSEDAAQKLKKRTLTNLYNERPAWLDLADQRLDEAVCAAYVWDRDISDDDLLARLLELNLSKG